MNSESITTTQSIRMRFNNGEEPIQGDKVNFSVETKNPKLDHIEKAEIEFSLSEILLFIPRLIITFFKS